MHIQRVNNIAPFAYPSNEKLKPLSHVRRWMAIKQFVCVCGRVLPFFVIQSHKINGTMIYWIVWQIASILCHIFDVRTNPNNRLSPGPIQHQQNENVSFGILKRRTFKLCIILIGMKFHFHKIIKTKLALCEHITQIRIAAVKIHDRYDSNLQLVTVFEHLFICLMSHRDKTW